MDPVKPCRPFAGFYYEIKNHGRDFDRGVT